MGDQCRKKGTHFTAFSGRGMLLSGMELSGVSSDAWRGELSALPPS